MSTVSLHVAVSNSTAAWLEREARGAGTNRSRVASAVLESAAQTNAALSGAAGLSLDERLRRFDRCMAQVSNRPGPPVDVSRDNLYDRVLTFNREDFQRFEDEIAISTPREVVQAQHDVQEGPE